jgi:hypothetical protein
MDGVPGRIGIAGVNWWPEEEITRRQAGSVIDGGPADVMVTHECPAGIEHAFPPPPSWWSPADLRRSDAHRDLLREVMLAVRPRRLIHGHLHLSYQRRVDLGGGQIEVTGLDCDGAPSGNLGDPGHRQHALAGLSRKAHQERSPQPGSRLTRVCRRRLIGCPARQRRWHWGQAFHPALAPRLAGTPREGRP